MHEGVFKIAAPGQILAGRYRLERLLARGGHGAVFVAEQLATEARVAVKVLLPHVLDDEDALRRFELEAKVAGRIASEYIVRTLDAGVDPGSGLPFIAMELLEGCSLSEAVNRDGPFSPLDTTTCILQVAQALDKAHGVRGANGRVRAIVHRDLKPENLFLTMREDGQRVVKILDFGTAKVVSESIARSRSVQGSPLYIAYEQLSGGAVSPRTDVWALGLIAFFLLTGRAYWKAAHPSSAGLSAIFAEILHMPLSSPTTRARELGIEPSWPPSFDAWFLRCVARSPDARFPSAGEAGRALLEALLGVHASDGEEHGLSAEEEQDDLHRELDREATIPRRRVHPGVMIAGGLSAAAVLVYALAPWSSAPGTLPLNAVSPAVRASLARGVVPATLPDRSPSAAVETPLVNPDTEPVRRVNAPPRARSSRPRQTPPASRVAPQSEPQSDDPPSHILNSPIYSER